jgi:putative MATE family efflux protein
LRQVALAAVAIASAIYAAVFAVFNFLEYAVTPLIAQSIGAGERDEAGRFTVAALAISVTAGVIAAAGLIVFSEPLLRAFGAGPEVVESATTYLRIRALGVPALLVILVGHGAFRGFQDTRTPLVVTLGLNAVNLVLDPILIFGLNWGVAGAAGATVVAQWFGAAWFLTLFFWTRRTELAIGFGRPQRAALRSLVGAGKALILRNASLLASLTAATVVAARVGTAAVAAHQIAMQLWIFMALVIDAFAIAGQAIVGKELGADSPAVARAVSNRLLALGASFGIILALVVSLVSPWLGSWFTSNAAVLAAFVSILPILIVMQPINGIVFVWDGIAIGAAAFSVLAWSTVAAAAAAIAFLLVVIPLGWGLVGVWTGIVVLMLVRAITLWWWYGFRFAVPERDPSPSSPAESESKPWR